MDPLKKDSATEIIKLQKNENDRLRKIISEKCEIISGLKLSINDFTNQYQIVMEKFQSEIDSLKTENEEVHNLLETKMASFLDKHSLAMDQKIKMNDEEETKLKNCVKTISLETSRLSRQIEFYKREKQSTESKTKRKFVEYEQELKLLKTNINETELHTKIRNLEQQLNEKTNEFHKTKQELDLATKSNFDQFVYLSGLEKQLVEFESLNSNVIFLKNLLEKSNSAFKSEKNISKQLSERIEVQRRQFCKESEKLRKDAEQHCQKSERHRKEAEQLRKEVQQLHKEAEQHNKQSEQYRNENEQQRNEIEKYKLREIEMKSALEERDKKIAVMKFDHETCLVDMKQMEKDIESFRNRIEETMHGNQPAAHCFQGHSLVRGPAPRLSSPPIFPPPMQMRQQNIFNWGRPFFPNANFFQQNETNNNYWF